MGIVDAFAAEDRVQVKFSDFYAFMKEAAKAEIMANGIHTRVPHEEIEKMLTGKNPELEEYKATGLTPEKIVEIDKLYAEKCEEVTALHRQLDEFEIQPKDVTDTIKNALEEIGLYE